MPAEPAQTAEGRGVMVGEAGDGLMVKTAAPEVTLPLGLVKTAW